LVQGRGHHIEQVPEIPLVVDGAIEKIQKTKEAIAALKALGAYGDVEKVAASRKIRRGRGKMRNRRHILRRGPLIVYNDDNGIVKAFRNLPGVETASVESLNLLQLAPGGHLGRFIVWTQGAFSRLNEIWGSTCCDSSAKKGYKLPRALISNSDVTRLINSDEVQSHVRAPIKSLKRRVQHKNPLKNLGARVKLNPFALTLRRTELLTAERRQKKKAAVLEAKRSGGNAPADAAADAKKAARKEHDKLQKVNYKRLTIDGYVPPPKPKAATKAKGAKPVAKAGKPAAKKASVRKESGADKPARKESAADKPASRKESGADAPARKESGADKPAAKKQSAKKK
jgi:hypothetical protein